jgi:O-methyltransferase
VTAIHGDQQDSVTVDTGDGAALYLDLMKRCLLDDIYADDPLAYYVPYQVKPTMPAWKRLTIMTLQRVLARYRIKLTEPFSIPWISDYTQLSEADRNAIRERGTAWPVRAHTMIGLKRLDNIQYCAETIIRDGIEGDFIETGVWRGGACIFMRAILKAYGETRTVWAADSFAGLPPPNSSVYAADAGDEHHTMSAWLACSQEQVKSNFARYGLLDHQVQFLKGWFKDTLPIAPIERLALLRLDGDMYESTKQALKALYPKLSPGGFVIVDDWHLKACVAAVQDFRATHRINDEILDIDGMSVYWRRKSVGGR